MTVCLSRRAAERGAARRCSRESVQPGPQWCTIRLAGERPNQVKTAAAMTDSPITEYRLTDHAQLEMERRQITVAQVAQVLAAPEQIEVVRPGRAG